MGTVGRGEGPRLRGPGQALEEVTVWPWEQGWETVLYLGEMGIPADSTLAV